jgi:cell division protein FtsI/penicillin-binding protein 2
VLGGGFLVLRREGWIKVSFQETKVIQGSYPADVVDMLPEIAKLKPAARKNLRHIIGKSGTAEELFAVVTKLTKKDEEPSAPTDSQPAIPPEE